MHKISEESFNMAWNLPAGKNLLCNKRGEHCALGKVIAAIEGSPLSYNEKVITMETDIMDFATDMGNFCTIGQLNDRGKHEEALRLAFQTAQERGIIELEDKAAEAFAKELNKVKC